MLVVGDSECCYRSFSVCITTIRTQMLVSPFFSFTVYDLIHQVSVQRLNTHLQSYLLITTQTFLTEKNKNKLKRY